MVHDLSAWRKEIISNITVIEKVDDFDGFIRIEYGVTLLDEHYAINIHPDYNIAVMERVSFVGVKYLTTYGEIFDQKVGDISFTHNIREMIAVELLQKLIPQEATSS